MPNLPPNPTKPDFKSLATLVRSSSPTTATIEEKRRTVAELCKLLGRRMLEPAASAEAAVVPTPTPPAARPSLSPSSRPAAARSSTSSFAERAKRRSVAQ